MLAVAKAKEERDAKNREAREIKAREAREAKASLQAAKERGDVFGGEVLLIRV